jgi:hypothetical protein
MKELDPVSVRHLDVNDEPPAPTSDDSALLEQARTCPGWLAEAGVLDPEPYTTFS